MHQLSAQELKLIEVLNQISQANYPIHSRVHDLSSFGQSCFIKRDDELGFGISGSKVRKYRTLIPFLLAQHIEEVVVIGSANSNHVLGITQLLIENHIKPILFLRGDPNRSQKGNSLFIQLFTDHNSLYWISKSNWPNVQQMAQEYAEQSSCKTFILPEGGSALECLSGAISLSLDISKNERDLNTSFEHIFIDSGTGMMASALILGYHWMHKSATIHVVLIAGNDDYFMNQLQIFHQAFEKMIGEQCSFPQNFKLYIPKEFASFGSHGTVLFKEMTTLAREEGFLCDPIYTAKLFKEAKNQLISGKVSGPTLIIHSGGALTLAGFQEQLQRLLL